MANLAQTINAIGADIKALQARGVQINGVKYGEYQRGTVERSQMELVSGSGNSSNFKVKFKKPFSKVPQIRFSATSTVRATVMYNVYEVTKDYFMFTQNYYGAEPTVEYEAFTDPEIVVAEQGLSVTKVLGDPSFKEGYVGKPTETWLQVENSYFKAHSYNFELLPFDFSNRVVAAGINATETFAVIVGAPYTDEQLQGMIDEGWVISDIADITQYVNQFQQNERRIDLYTSFKMLTNPNIKLAGNEVDDFNSKSVTLSTANAISLYLSQVVQTGYPHSTLFDKPVNKLLFNYNVLGNMPLK